MSPERYLTPEDVGELLKVHAKTVHRWASADPTMPVLRLGGGDGKRATLRFPESRLVAWLRAREQGIGQPRAKKPLHSEPASKGQVLDLASVRAAEKKAAG